MPTPPPVPVAAPVDDDAFDDLGEGAIVAVRAPPPRIAEPGGPVDPRDVARLRERMRAVADDLRARELAFHAREGTWLDCGSPAEARARMAQGDTAWVSDGCWTTLGFALSAVPGGWYVEIRAAATNFMVHGLLDLDGDGQPAEVLASRDLAGRFGTPESVR